MIRQLHVQQLYSALVSSPDPPHSNFPKGGGAEGLGTRLTVPWVGQLKTLNKDSQQLGAHHLRFNSNG